MTSQAQALSTPDVALSIHRSPIPGVYDQLLTRLRGLTPAEVEERRQRYGPNAIREIKGKPLWLRFLANFTHLMALLLWVGGIVGFARMPQLGIAMWMVNVINGLFSFWQEYKAEKATEALRRLLSPMARVVFDGEERRIPAAEAFPGNMLLLAEGDRIAADGRLVCYNTNRHHSSIGYVPPLTYSGQVRAGSATGSSFRRAGSHE